MGKLSALVFGLTVLSVRCAHVGDTDSYLDALQRSHDAEANGERSGMNQLNQYIRQLIEK